MSARFPSKLVCVLFGACAFAAFAQTNPPVTSTTQPNLARLGGLPLCFEANRGQSKGPAQFLARGANYHFLLAPAEARIVLRKAALALPAGSRRLDQIITPQSARTRALRMQFLGANSQARMAGQSEMGGKINYLTGRDSTQWHAGVTTFARVQVKGVYPGIDLVYYGNQQRLEYDFTVAPGADPAAIAIYFDGAEKLAVDAQGELVLTLGEDEICQPPPALYQTIGGVRQTVSGGYRLKDARTVEFAVGPYDHSQPLIIDPVLSYSSLLSGNNADTAQAVKVDASGSIYVAGITLANQFLFEPTNVFQTTNGGGIIDGDGFVAKFDNTGTNLIFFTYLGGTNDDGVFDMVLDSSNNIYLTGFTDSPDFPVVPAGGVPGLPSGAQIAGPPDAYFNLYSVDAFVTELAAGGSNLVFSTFLGGSTADVGGGIALDPSNYVYVTGYTYSTNFPTTNALVLPSPVGGTTFTVLNQLIGTNAAFVAKFAPAGAALVYSTFLGGTNINEGEGIAADAAGFAYVTGYTDATNFPLTSNALQSTFNHSTNAAQKYAGVHRPAFDAFVVQIAPLGSNLVYSTYLGGTNNDAGNRICVDANTNVYVTGYSESPDFTNTVRPIVIPPGITNIAFPNSDAFLTKISFASPTPALVYSSLFGGNKNDVGWDVAVDANGDAFVVGTTGSTNFPAVNTNYFLLATNMGKNDVFVTAFNPDATELIYSVCLGGNDDDYGYGIALDAQANAYIVGKTLSTNFPVVSPFGPPVRWTNAFLAKILTVIPTNDVTIQTVPANLPIVLDGVTNIAPVITNWLFGSVHTITAPLTNSVVGGVQYVWSSWSDGGFVSHPVMISSNLTFTATFGTQYFLSMNATNGGAVSPPSGWYAPGTNVSIQASPASGGSFAGWTGTGSGSFSGAANPATVTMNGPITETAAFTGTLNNVLTVIINGSGTVSPDYNGQTLQVGQSYTMTAKPASGFIFTGWSGGFIANTPALSFQMQDGLVLVANFAPNPFVPVQGTYAGLLYDTNNITFQDSGFFSATVSDNGAFSAKMLLGKQSILFTGQFPPDGIYYTNRTRLNQNPLLIMLQLGPNGGNYLTGLVNDGLSTAQLVANRAVFSSTKPSPLGGNKYTLLIPGGTNALGQPQGESFGVVYINPAGVAQFSGTLGDGTRATQSSFISEQGLWPFYVSLYSGKGSIFGWLAFTNPPGVELSGVVNWFKLPQPKAKFYPAGFAFASLAMGSVYSSGQAPLNFSQGQLVLEGGNNLPSTTIPISVSGDQIVSRSGAAVSLTISSSSGLFRGSVLDPLTGRPTPVSGAVLQNQGLGAGSFFGTNESGAILIGP